MPKFIGFLDTCLPTSKHGPSFKGIAILVAAALITLLLLVRFCL